MFVNNGDEGMIMVLTSLLLYIYIVYTNVLTVDSNFCFFCVMCIFMCAHLSQRQYGPIYDDIFRKVLLKHQHTNEGRTILWSSAIDTALGYIAYTQHWES